MASLAWKPRGQRGIKGACSLSCLEQAIHTENSIHYCFHTGSCFSCSCWEEPRAAAAAFVVVLWSGRMAAAPKHCTACSLFALGLAGYARIFLQLVFTIVLQMRRSGSRGSQDVHSVPQHNSRASGRVCVCVYWRKNYKSFQEVRAWILAMHPAVQRVCVCIYEPDNPILKDDDCDSFHGSNRPFLTLSLQ